jgi:hypothetical protein
VAIHRNLVAALATDWVLFAKSLLDKQFPGWEEAVLIDSHGGSYLDEFPVAVAANELLIGSPEQP